jgi:hypothetical protein
VFAIDIETCRQCGGRLRVIASIEQPASLNGSSGTSAVRPAPSMRDTRWTWCADYGQRSLDRNTRISA